MLTSSSTLPVDTQITHTLVSGGRVTTVRSKRKSRTWSHQRHRNFTSAFGGYFAGNYLASFKNKQNAVVLTTFKKDVEHERVRLELQSHTLNCHANSCHMTYIAKQEVLNGVMLHLHQAGQPWDDCHRVGEGQTKQQMPREYSGFFEIVQAASWYPSSSTYAWHCKSIERLSGDCYAVDVSENQAYLQTQMAIGNMMHISYSLRHAPAFPLAVCDVCF